MHFEIKPKFFLDPKGIRFADPSLVGILISNLAALYLALNQQWPLVEIMWIYWAQSVTIGATNFVRLHRLSSFSTKGLTMNSRPVPETKSGKRFVANFFALHYGIFHFVYMVFLLEKFNPFTAQATDSLWFILTIALFVASHVYSLFHNQSEDLKQRKPNIGTLMFYPYLRIIPMHLTILIGGNFGTDSLWLFMSLKTAADVGMHIVEHALFRQKEEGVQLGMRIG